MTKKYQNMKTAQNLIGIVENIQRKLAEKKCSMTYWLFYEKFLKIHEICYFAPEALRNVETSYRIEQCI